MPIWKATTHLCFYWDLSDAAARFPLSALGGCRRHAPRLAPRRRRRPKKKRPALGRSVRHCEARERVASSYFARPSIACCTVGSRCPRARSRSAAIWASGDRSAIGQAPRQLWSRHTQQNRHRHAAQTMLLQPSSLSIRTRRFGHGLENVAGSSVTRAFFCEPAAGAAVRVVSSLRISS